MSTSPIGLSSSSLEQMLASALQNAGVTASATNGTGSTAGIPSDSSQLSTFAQLVSSLQQLQQSNPAEYSKVTAQVATNLESAAQRQKSQGNSAAANQLNELASDFTKASQTGQLPDLQNLAQAIGGSGGHHHHHHGSGEASSASSTSTPADDSTSSASNQYLLNAGQDSSTSAADIILQTLSDAGVNSAG